MDTSLHLLTLLISLVAFQASSQQQQLKRTPYTGPSCLAEFCFNGSGYTSLPSERKIVAKYGPGTRIGDTRCYSVSERHAFIHFDVEQPELSGRFVTVVLSDVPNCLVHTKLEEPTVPFPPLRTEHGIGLGDSYEKIVHTYGKPTAVEDGSWGNRDIVPHQRFRKGMPFGQKALIYNGPSDSLIQGIFYLRDGKVAGIYISVAE